MDDRPYTNAVEFDGDWRGVFIQGQDALMHYAYHAGRLIDELDEAEPGRGSDKEVVVHETVAFLRVIQRLMLQANHHDTEVQPYKLKPWKECLRDENDYRRDPNPWSTTRT